jgi:hypothetical protein
MTKKHFVTGPKNIQIEKELVQIVELSETDSQTGFSTSPCVRL